MDRSPPVYIGEEREKRRRWLARSARQLVREARRLLEESEATAEELLLDPAIEDRLHPWETLHLHRFAIDYRARAETAWVMAVAGFLLWAREGMPRG